MKPPPGTAAGPEPPPGSSSPAQAFHLFGKLPVELRLRIWTLNLPETRVLPIRCGDALTSPAPSPPLRPSSTQPSSTASSSSSASLSPFTSGPVSPPLPLPVPASVPPGPPPPPPGPPCRCTCSSPIPTNLHVCQESREDALRHYRLAFGIARQPPRIFVDPERDVLYFGPRDGYMASEAQFRTVLALARPEDLALVRRLALNDALFWADAAAAPRSYHSAVAASLTVGVLRQVRRRLPGLRELIFVPRDGNPVYSGEAALVEPPVEQPRLANQIRVAMANVAQQFPEWEPPEWSIMSLSSSSDSPAFAPSPEAVLMDGGMQGDMAGAAEATAASGMYAGLQVGEEDQGCGTSLRASTTADLDGPRTLEIRTNDNEHEQEERGEFGRGGPWNERRGTQHE